MEKKKKKVIAIIFFASGRYPCRYHTCNMYTLINNVSRFMDDSWSAMNVYHNGKFVKQYRPGMFIPKLPEGLF